MAYCPNCGTQLPIGAAFCTECGAKVDSAASTGSSAPRFSGSKKPLIIGISAVLLIGIVLGVLFLTGVLGRKGPVGTWSYTEPGVDGEKTVLVLEKGGTGYCYWTDSTRDYDSIQDAYVLKVFRYYDPLTWSDSVIYYDGDLLFYTVEGSTMTVQYNREPIILTRVKDEDPGKTLKAGKYTLTAFRYRGNDRTEDTIRKNGESAMLIEKEGTGYWNVNGSLRQLSWKKHFITLDGEDLFYSFDGSHVTIYDGIREYEFVLQK